jgi:cellulose synthase (UDP-forming)
LELGTGACPHRGLNVTMDAYFHAFEDRRPPPPLAYSAVREMLWQALATLTLVLGAWYLAWRWLHSLNPDAMWFALPLVIGETLAYAGLVLFVFNLWQDQPIVVPDPPAVAGEVDPVSSDLNAPITVDVMFATYNEEPELVRLGLRDAKAMEYPYPIDVRIHILDDGRREAMRALAEEEGVGYISRATNEGFKAGNLRHAMEQTSGTFIVICDADTRPFPTFLARTLGHFRDPKVAWVQTPQWFYDLPEGEPLSAWLTRHAGRLAGQIGTGIERVVGEVRLGADPFVNDPQMFYDVIQRRRNKANAAFCCGAGSIHRREAVMEAALRAFGARVERRVIDAEEEITLESRERTVAPVLLDAIRTEAVQSEILTPYKFHVSEDIYTSIVLHSDRARAARFAHLDDPALQVRGRQPRHPRPRQPADPTGPDPSAADDVWRDLLLVSGPALERGLLGRPDHLPFHGYCPCECLFGRFLLSRRTVPDRARTRDDGRHLGCLRLCG